MKADMSTLGEMGLLPICLISRALVLFSIAEPRPVNCELSYFPGELKQPKSETERVRSCVFPRTALVKDAV